MTDEYVGELVHDQGTPVASIDMGQPIVRCMDCAHAIDNGVEGAADYCGRPDGDGGYLLFAVEPRGFCAWGKRRERR